MEAVKRGGRAHRYQRTARHAHRAPNNGRRTNSLARREAETTTWETVLLVVAIVVAILVCGLIEGPDLEEHAAWEAQVKEQGAWVMW